MRASGITRLKNQRGAEWTAALPVWWRDFEAVNGSDNDFIG